MPRWFHFTYFLDMFAPKLGEMIKFDEHIIQMGASIGGLGPGGLDSDWDPRK